MIYRKPQVDRVSRDELRGALALMCLLVCTKADAGTIWWQVDCQFVDNIGSVDGSRHATGYVMFRKLPAAQATTESQLRAIDFATSGVTITFEGTKSSSRWEHVVLIKGEPIAGAGAPLMFSVKLSTSERAVVFGGLERNCWRQIQSFVEANGNGTKIDGPAFKLPPLVRPEVSVLK